MSVSSTKPTRYPPVVPSRDANPPRKPANTGAPTAPSSRYTSTLTVPRLPPSRPHTAKIANVCSVNGTSAGMLIHAHTAMSAAPIAQKHRSLVENFIRSPPIVKQSKDKLNNRTIAHGR